MYSYGSVKPSPGLGGGFTLRSGVDMTGGGSHGLSLLGMGSSGRSGYIPRLIRGPGALRSWEFTSNPPSRGTPGLPPRAPSHQIHPGGCSLVRNFPWAVPPGPPRLFHPPGYSTPGYSIPGTCPGYLRGLSYLNTVDIPSIKPGIQDTARKKCENK